MFRSDCISDGNVEGVTEHSAPTARPAPAPRVPSNDAATIEPAEVVSALDAIENQPLEERAAAYAQLHDRLRDHLEGGDVPRSTDALPGNA